MNNNELGERISALRKECGLTQRQLAEQLNTTDKTISKWETGRNVPDLDTLNRMAAIFGCNLETLVNGTVVETETSAGRKHRVSWRVWMILAVVLAVVVTVVTVPSVLLGGEINGRTARKIEIGMNEADMLLTLGTPHSTTYTGGEGDVPGQIVYLYFEASFEKKYRRLLKLTSELPKDYYRGGAVGIFTGADITDWEMRAKAFGQYAKMYEAMQDVYGTVHRCIAVSVNRDTHKVDGVAYDTHAILGEAYKTEKTKKSRSFEFNQEFILSESSLAEGGLTYKAKYSDGSYRVAVVYQLDDLPAAADGPYTVSIDNGWCVERVLLVAHANSVTVVCDETDGSVTGTGYYDAGQSVTVTATEGNNRRFVGWYEDGEQVSSDYEYTYVNEGAKRTLEAKFEIADFTKERGFEAFLVTRHEVGPMISGYNKARYSYPLTELKIPDKIAVIDRRALMSGPFQTLTCPDSLVLIGDSAFSDCKNLSTVNLDVNIRSIEGRAFYGCVNLRYIYYAGTKAQWQNVFKASSYLEGVTSCVIHCSDGNVAP